MRRRVLALLGAGMLMLSTQAAQAITVSPNTDANDLADALVAPATGITVTAAILNGHTLDSGEASSGTFTNESGTYGIGDGVILSTGDVADYEDGENTTDSNTTAYGTETDEFGFPIGVPATPEQEAILDPITQDPGEDDFDHFDVTELLLTFDVDEMTQSVAFDVVFGSEEFDEFVGNAFIDGFGLFLNGTNIAFVDGQPVNINHPDMDFFDGTELNGVLGGSDNPAGQLVHTFAGNVTPGSTGNTLRFIIADTSDAVLDSTVYISGLEGREEPVETPQEPVDGIIPEPMTASLGLMGLGVLGWATRRRRGN